MVNFNITEEKKNLALLKIEKTKLEALLGKIKTSHQELITANLSGKIYEQCLLNCDFFEKAINDRLIHTTNLITLLESICTKYETAYNNISQTVGE